MQTYEIIDGVRRAKAADFEGQDSIWAVVEGEILEQRLLIRSLLSPKPVIDVSTPRELTRWETVRLGMSQEPDLLPPIVVRPGSNGIPIRNVSIIGGPP